MRRPSIAAFISTCVSLFSRPRAPRSSFINSLTPPSSFTALPSVTTPTTPVPLLPLYALQFLHLSMTKRSKPKFYAIRKGRDGFSGVVHTWDECKPLVNGVNGAIFKSFATMSEAVTFSGGVARSSASACASRSGSSSASPSLPIAKPGQIRSWRATSTAQPKRNKPGHRQTMSDAVTSHSGEVVSVYTDGACTDNGTSRARAGVGAWFGDGHEANVSEPLEGKIQTNQRAEMTGVLRAMNVALDRGIVLRGMMLSIYSDSSVCLFAT